MTDRYGQSSISVKKLVTYHYIGSSNGAPPICLSCSTSLLRTGVPAVTERVTGDSDHRVFQQVACTSNAHGGY